MHAKIANGLIKWLEPGDVLSGLASSATKVTATVQSCVEQTL